MTAALALIGLGLPIGFLIGLIGIGGVLLTPALVHLFGLDIHASISLSLASFVLAGVVGAARVTTDDARLRAGDWVFLAAIVRRPWQARLWHHRSRKDRSPWLFRPAWPLPEFPPCARQPAKMIQSLHPTRWAASAP
jgi:hypothetical protein